jgi:hypothetical protein
MKFVIIDPKERQVKKIEAENSSGACGWPQDR